MKNHPNGIPFRGVLTILDAPSDRPPAGARGHRVVLTRAAAEAALPSLIGMAVDFTAGFDGHDARRKVGIITSADIKAGSKTTIAVAGYIFARGGVPERLGLGQDVLKKSTRRSVPKLLRIVIPSGSEES